MKFGRPLECGRDCRFCPEHQKMSLNGMSAVSEKTGLSLSSASISTSPKSARVSVSQGPRIPNSDNLEMHPSPKSGAASA